MINKRNKNISTLLKQLCILIVILIVYSVQATLLKRLIIQDQQPKVIYFQLPLSEQYQDIFSLPANPEIESVYLSGSFNNWNPQDETFKMPVTSKNTWSYSLKSVSGDIQYKYVVTVKNRPDIIWLHDTRNSKKINDGYGGYNSILSSPHWIQYSETFSTFLIALLIASSLYFLFHWLNILLFKSKVKLTHKYLILFSLLLIFSNTIIILYNNQRKQNMSKIAYSEMLNLIYTGLKGHNIDFNDLDNPSSQKLIKDYFDSYFAGLKARSLLQEYTSARGSIHRILLFNTNFHIVGFGDRTEFPLSTANKSKQHYIEDVYEKGVFKKLISQMKTSPAKNTQYSLYRGDVGRNDITEYDKMSSLLSYNILLSPIIEDFELKAYIGLMLFPHLFATEIKRNRRVNIIWNVIVIAFAILFLLQRIKSPLLNEKILSKFFQSFEITSREQEIIRLILDGMKYSEVASKLFISEKTVKAHIYNIYQKAGVENKMGLISCIKDSK